MLILVRFVHVYYVTAHQCNRQQFHSPVCMARASRSATSSHASNHCNSARYPHPKVASEIMLSHLSRIDLCECSPLHIGNFNHIVEVHSCLNLHISEHFQWKKIHSIECIGGEWAHQYGSKASITVQHKKKFRLCLFRSGRGWGNSADTSDVS